MTKFLHKILRQAIKKDNDLQALIHCIKSRNWPTPPMAKLDAYYSKRSKLTINNGCIYWGQRIIIPQSMRGSILKELHKGHPV